VPGCGLARPANFVVPHGLAQHKNRPIMSCLGRRLGPRDGVALPVGHGVPSRPGDHWAVPARYRAMLCRAGPMPIFSKKWQRSKEPKT
jgi:hypothetical protein